MKKRDAKEQNHFYYDDEGVDLVTAQIMDSYSSGVIGETEEEQFPKAEQTDY